MVKKRFSDLSMSCAFKKWDIRLSHAVHHLRSRNEYEERVRLLGAHISLAGGRVMVVTTVRGSLQFFCVFALTELNMSLCLSSICYRLGIQFLHS